MWSSWYRAKAAAVSRADHPSHGTGPRSEGRAAPLRPQWPQRLLGDSLVRFGGWSLPPLPAGTRRPSQRLSYESGEACPDSVGPRQGKPACPPSMMVAQTLALLGLLGSRGVVFRPGSYPRSLPLKPTPWIPQEPWEASGSPIGRWGLGRTQPSHSRLWTDWATAE